MNTVDTAVVVFVKKPLPGLVKTRLAKTYGNRGSARIARRLAEHQLRNLSSLDGVDVVLSCSPDTSHPFFSRLQDQTGCRAVRQEKGDLGRRMFTCFKSMLKQYRHVVIIGTDCPELDAGVIRQALNELRSGAEVVLGPSVDGGYYLVGADKTDPGLFSGISWGTSSVLNDSIRRLDRLGWRYRLLGELMDIDTADDVRKLKRSRLLYRHDWQV